MHNYGSVLNILSTLLLVLHFDGSLRIPPDSNTNTVPPLAPFATCSSAILDEVSGDIVALGAKEVHSSFGRKITSADVEYEGLLLGLNCLLEILQKNPEITSNKNVIIRGDCKTVMDQFKGKSIPRKLRFYHQSCMNVLEQLENYRNVTFRFQHVGREHNELCDRMCKVMLLHLKDRVIYDALNLIQTTEMHYRPLPLPRNTKKRMTHVETPFRKAIDQISILNGDIPASVRSYLLCEMYHASKRVGDLVAVRLIGMAMYDESRRLKKSQANEQGNTVFHNLGLIGMKFCHDSLLAMDLDQEAQKLKKLVMVEFGNVSLIIADEEVKDLQSHLRLNLDFRNMAICMLQDLASKKEDYQKLLQWNDHVSRMVHDSNLEEEYPCLIFQI